MTIVNFKSNLIGAVKTPADYYLENISLNYSRPLPHKKYIYYARRFICATRNLKRFVLWPDYGRGAGSIDDLPEFIIKGVEYFNKTADPRDFSKLRHTVFTAFGISAIPNGATVNKDYLMLIIFDSIREFPASYGRSFSAYGLLRGRVKAAEYDALGSALYDACDDCPHAKNALIEDLFAPLRASSACDFEHPFHEFYAGLGLYDISTWRALLGNPLAADCQISGDPLEEMEIIVHVYRSAFTSAQQRRIFDSKWFFDYFATGKVLKRCKFSIDEVEEVWSALYRYFLRGSTSRDVLLKLVPGPKKLKRWYGVHVLMEEFLPMFRGKFRRLRVAIAANLPFLAGSSAAKRRKTAAEELEAKAAFKIFSLALSREQINNVFLLRHFGNNFCAARRAWPLDSAAEDRLCRAFIARFSPRFSNWIFEQLVAAFPAGERDLASHERRIERLIEKNNGGAGRVKRAPGSVERLKAEKADLSYWVVFFTAACFIFDYIFSEVYFSKALIAAVLYFILRLIAKNLRAGYNHKHDYDYLCDYVRVVICITIFVLL